MSAKPKILFVDDDPLMHRLYQPHIERAGYEMLGGMDGAAALRLVASEQPQVVVMDLVMPGADGVTAIREIKRVVASRSIPVIAISDDPQYHALRHELTHLGADLFLSKPFSPAQLLSQIQQLQQITPAKKDSFT